MGWLSWIMRRGKGWFNHKDTCKKEVGGTWVTQKMTVEGRGSLAKEYMQASRS